VGPVPQGRQDYLQTLRTLSEASTHGPHFDAFHDIDWGSPEFAVVTDDERWILGEEDELGAHPWYRSLPRDRQIEIGMYRYANMCKTGRQFEQLLIAGLMFYLNRHHANNNPEFRYATHEATEETHHTQMFQQLVDRVGIDVQGAPRWLVETIPAVAWIAALFPELFFLVILAGEEPIDHVQKNALRSGREIHPMLERVVQIHIAEEARHIGFAHSYLQERVPDLGLVARTVLALSFPIILRLGVDAILKPTHRARRDLGIPEEVYRDVWWDSDSSRTILRHLFTDVRMLADDLKMRGPVARLLWKAMKIDGKPARYRAQPHHATH
jgi:hypothetical protein